MASKDSFLVTSSNACGVVVFILFAALNVFFFALSTVVAVAEDIKDGKHQHMSLFVKAFEQVKSNYVEEVNDRKLVENAIQGMVSGLDPHSAYFDEKSYNNMQTATRGEFGGIGVEVTLDKGLVKVVSPYESGPAFRAGVKVGDAIVAVDREDIVNMNLADVAEKLRGNPGSTVKVRVYRENGERAEFEIVRELIHIIPVKAKLIANDTIVYIKISSFNSKTAGILKSEYSSIEKSLKEKSKKGPDGVILDLRWNPGGLLEQAAEVADLFLRNTDIVSIRGRNPEQNRVYRSGDNDITGGLPIVALVNGGSASAAEIVAGALQDNKRGLIVGTKSFGKGSVQAMIPLSNNGSSSGNGVIKLTTALYYTPLGRSIQAEGILPDIIVPEGAIVKSTERSDISSEFLLKGHIKKPSDTQEEEIKKDSKDAESTADLSADNIRGLVGDENRDFQLSRAIDALRTMTLYNSQLYTRSLQ
ncbi:carboxyl-terminal processing protease [Alphaproteobacteria bacterium]